MRAKKSPLPSYAATVLILLGCPLVVCSARRSACQEKEVLSRTTAKASEQNAVAKEKTSAVGYEAEFPALGTLVGLKAYHQDKSLVELAFSLAEQKVHDLETILTDYDSNSETRRLSERAIFADVAVSEPLWDVLTASENWYRISDGAFDASLGALTRLWRKHRRSDRAPTQDEIRRALAHCGWQHVRLEPTHHTVRFQQAGLQLDFGAIGKGYIVDQAFQVIVAQGLACSLVNIGGNMRAGEPPPGREGWRIEIAPLESGGAPLRRVLIANQAIATSGDLWQFMMIDGKRISHLLDPTTGQGVAGPLCATVIADSATDADALATIACIVGFDRTLAIVRQMKNTEVLIADKISSESPRIQATSGFPLSVD